MNGPGSMNSEPLRIGVDIERDGNQVVFTYRDDGPGYPERVLRDGEHNTGLFVVKNVAQADLGGELRLYNDGGAVVEVRFTGDGGETRQERTDPGAGG